ncbi:MAG: hypothetical protein IPP32_14395 [Bacteroidetes bacterium]|nr:hypothetical protein [Bacteroidota bacterium]
MKGKIVLIFILLAIASCKKISNSKIDAKIYVKQYKTEEPIVNSEVQIFRGKPGTGFGTELVETIYTNTEGIASYKTSVDKDFDYYAFAKADNYFNDGDQVILERGKRHFKTTIYKYANSYVKIHIKNANPYNQYDLIQFSSACLSGHYQFQGSNIDTTFLWCDVCGCSWYGSYPYQGAGLVTKNGIEVGNFFSFTPIPFDTLTININY